VNWNDITWAQPQWLWLSLALPLAAVWMWWSRNKTKAPLLISGHQGLPVSRWVSGVSVALNVLRILALGGMILALARPQIVSTQTKTKTTRGIDIVMSIDVSSSMLAKDLKPNRLTALKKIAATFIESRPNDRIGLVVYAGESYTKTPITSDKGLVLRALDEIQYGGLNDGTAIGMGLATSVNRLKESKAQSKVVILLTDGVNNSGFIEPLTAAELAVEYGIKTYTIGVGTNGNAQFPVAINPDGSFQYAMQQVEIDETLMKRIAEKTGGQYFRAQDNQELEAIYNEINQLEKTEIEEFKFTTTQELYRPLVLFALFIGVLYWLLQHTWLKSFV
jgi:Ca-activated chloride channel family protein